MSVEDHPNLHGYELYKALREDQIREEHPEWFVEAVEEPVVPEPEHIFETWDQLESYIDEWERERDPSIHYKLWYDSDTIFWGRIGMDDGDLSLTFCPDTPEFRQTILDGWNKGIKDGWDAGEMLYEFLSDAPFHVSTRQSFWG